MSARILVFGLIFYCVSFSSADGVYNDGLFTDAVSTDGLLLFNDESIDPVQNTHSLDPTKSDLISEDLDGFDTFLNDPGSDLFAGSFDSINDPTLVADCTSINNDDYLGKKKARTRRQAACRNRASDFNPNLSLPTLHQIFPTDNENPVPPNSEDPTPPENRRPDKTMNTVVIPGIWTGELIYAIKKILWDCPDVNSRTCSSSLESDTQLSDNGGIWTLLNAERRKFFVFLPGSFHASIFLQNSSLFLLFKT